MLSLDRVVNQLKILHGESTEAAVTFALAEDIINRMNGVDWKDPSTTLLDPACGRGMFLIAAYKRLLSNGHSNKHIINNMLYGVDLNNLQCRIARRALYDLSGIEPNIEQANSLTKEWNMDFSAIVGNPPFQESKADGERKDQASNLWSKFWVKGLEIVKPNGTVALITPTTWLAPSADLKGDDKINGENKLWNVFDQYSSYADVVNVAKHFPYVGSTFGYVIVDKSGSNGLVFSDGADTSLGFRPKSGLDRVKLEIHPTENLEKYFAIDQANRADIRVSIPLTRTLTPDSIELLQGVSTPTKGSDKPELYLYIHTNDYTEAQAVQAKIIQCLDILNTHCRWVGFMNIKIVKLLAYTPA